MSLDKKSQLKELRAKKKEIAEQQKLLSAELNEGKEERVKARKNQSEARRTIHKSRGELRQALRKCQAALGEDSETCKTLADTIVESSAEIAKQLRNFADAQEVLELL